MRQARKPLRAIAIAVVSVISYRLISRSFLYREFGWGGVAWIEFGLEDLVLLAAVFVAVFVLAGKSR